MESDDSYSGGFRIRFRKQTMASSSPFLFHMKTMLNKRKLPKKTIFVSLKRNWNKSDELLILKGIVDYENETNFSHKSDRDAFYRYIKDSIYANFSKHQLMNKVKQLEKRFKDNNRKGLSFANTDEDQVFKLSNIIWATKNETEVECGSNEILDQGKDVPNVEHERVRNISMKIDNGGKDESEKDEFCVLKNALEETSFLPGIQHKLLLHNLKKLKAEERKELSDEWKAFHLEELQLNIKKLIFVTKLASVLIP